MAHLTMKAYKIKVTYKLILPYGGNLNIVIERDICWYNFKQKSNWLFFFCSFFFLLFTESGRKMSLPGKFRTRL